MKFGQLIESNMKNIFVEKLYTECGGVYFSTICLWINSQKFYKVCFYCMSS